jgi:hypothetical protein
MRVLMLNNKLMYFGLLLTVTVSYFVFYDTFLFQVWQTTNSHWVSDVPVHAQYIQKFSEGGYFPVYSLWYRLVYLLSGFSLGNQGIVFISISLLTGLIGIKYLINYWILKSNTTNKKLVVFVSFALIFVMPIVSYYTSEDPNLIFINKFHFYLGNISSNQWHNSTLILAMPLNLLLFYYSVNRINSERLVDFLMMGFLAIACILCKPNYAMAVLPVLAVAVLATNIRLGHYLKAVSKCLPLVIPSAAILVYQWYFTFVHNDLFQHNTKTVIAPFLVWETFSPHFFLSLLLSITFPLAVLISYYNKMDRYLIMSWLVFLVALGMFALLAEYPDHEAGNYLWGSIAANYILFLFSAKLLLNQSLDWKAMVAYGLFGLHFLSGCFFLASFFIWQTSLIM